MDKNYVKGLIASWHEVHDCMFCCTSETERNLLRGACNRILALSGYDIENGKNSFKWDKEGNLCQSPQK